MIMTARTIGRIAISAREIARNSNSGNSCGDASALEAIKKRNYGKGATSMP
jgi:hypothetical protein